jgi:hypothetical protein
MKVEELEGMCKDHSKWKEVNGGYIIRVSNPSRLNFISYSMFYSMPQKLPPWAYSAFLRGGAREN